MLLTIGPKFDRIASATISKSAKSLAALTEKVPFEELASGPVLVFPSANEIQMNLLLTNQQPIMATQQQLMSNQHAMERRMDKLKSPMLQLMRALQKGNM